MYTTHTHWQTKNLKRHGPSISVYFSPSQIAQTSPVWKCADQQNKVTVCWHVRMDLSSYDMHVSSSSYDMHASSSSYDMHASSSSYDMHASSSSYEMHQWPWIHYVYVFMGRIHYIYTYIHIYRLRPKTRSSSWKQRSSSTWGRRRHSSRRVSRSIAVIRSVCVCVCVCVMVVRANMCLCVCTYKYLQSSVCRDNVCVCVCIVMRSIYVNLVLCVDVGGWVERVDSKTHHESEQSEQRE